MPRVRLDPPLPWERQPEESVQAWEAFRVHRDSIYESGPNGEPAKAVRSNRETARRVGKQRGLMDRWALRHDWKGRVQAYDADLDRERRSILRAQAINATKQHAQIAQGLLTVIAMPLRAITKPQVLVDPAGNPLVNEDGVVLTRERTLELESLPTAQLALLLRTLASMLPTAISAQMEALGNPNEPLPELPEWGSDPSTEPAEQTPPDRMYEILRAADESGLLAMAAGLTEEHAAEVPELAPGAVEANGHP
jgi:hypothetical protein